MFFLRFNSPQRLNRLLEIHCHQKNRRSFFGRKSATPIPQLIPKHIYSSQDVIPSEITSSDYTVVSDYESDGWPIYQRLPPERVLEKYFATKGLVKNSIFVVGPEGSGKTVVINSVMKKLKEDERQDIRFIILNFEEYFKIPMNLVKDNEPPPVLDDFLTFFQDWFQPKLYNFLIATLDDTVDLISPLEVYDILTESTCIRYSLKQDIIESKIIDHLNKKKDGQSLDFMKEFQSFSSNLWGYSPRKLFQLYCNELSDMSTISNHHESALQEKVAKENYNQSPLAIAFKLAFKFLNKTELKRKISFGLGTWEFFLSTLEMVTEKSQHYEQDQYLKEHKLNHHSTSITVSDAHEEEPIIPSLGNPSKNSSTTDAITQRSRPRIIYPKIVIHGLHLLDIYCKTVSWRYRDDYFQRSVTEPEDYRASDLHDVILLRIVGMYLDPSVAIVIETHGNYYNWQMVDELKMDVDQVTFLEILEYPREECKTVFGNLFSDEEFYGIYDKVGGNAAKFKALFKIYHNIKEDEIPQYYQDKPFSRLKYAQSIYLIEEEDMFQRKLQSAHVLCAKYISQFKNLTMELPYDSMEVQFAMMDMIDAIFHYELQGVLHWTFIRHSDVQETPAGCALINSELFYIQFIHEQIRPYHDCYYNLIINWRDQRKKDWGVWNRIMYRWWRKLHGIGSLTVFTKWFRRKPQL